ncbi:hypothetical protein N7486_003147 [Penicillium sp. IBT 16267x]|nr:hypothetical protein N7486_003147 [Penicillium sp. IBT 16267x]
MSGTTVVDRTPLYPWEVSRDIGFAYAPRGVKYNNNNNNNNHNYNNNNNNNYYCYYYYYNNHNYNNNNNNNYYCYYYYYNNDMCGAWYMGRSVFPKKTQKSREHNPYTNLLCSYKSDL